MIVLQFFKISTYKASDVLPGRLNVHHIGEHFDSLKHFVVSCPNNLCQFAASLVDSLSYLSVTTYLNVL